MNLTYHSISITYWPYLRLLVRCGKQSMVQESNFNLCLYIIQENQSESFEIRTARPDILAVSFFGTNNFFSKISSWTLLFIASSLQCYRICGHIVVSNRWCRREISICVLYTVQENQAECFEISVWSREFMMSQCRGLYGRRIDENRA